MTEAHDPVTMENEGPLDLGFGARVAGESKLRLLNRDGTFNVSRHGLPFFRQTTVYEFIHGMAWWRFYLLALAVYLLINVIFAGAYLLAGRDAIVGATGPGLADRFGDAFFFSIHTITTVGYGHLHPGNLAAEILAAIEALFGLGGFAVLAALVFSRLAHPPVNILFSDRAVIAPYGDGEGFEFRIVNGGRSQLVQVEVRLVFSRIEVVNGRRSREFYELDLERRKVDFFPLHWTVVHPIDESSPLYGVSKSELERCKSEFLIQIAAFDETYSEIVHARRSYVAEEVEWDARFRDIFQEYEDGVIGIDMRRIDEIESLRPAGTSSRGLGDT